MALYQNYDNDSAKQKWRPELKQENLKKKPIYSATSGPISE